MLIVFNSITHGNCGNSVNAALMSLLISRKSKGKNILIQIGNSENKLDYLFGLAKENNIEYEMELGIDAIIMGLRAGRLDEDLVRSCTYSIDKTNLSIMLGPSSDYQDYQEMILVESYLLLIDKLEKLYELVFVDIGIAKNNILAKRIIERSNVVITSLCQNLHVINQAIDTNYLKVTDKNYYLVGKYQDNLKWNYHNLRKQYKVFSKKNLGFIPYHNKISDAVNGKGLADFIERYIEVEEWEEVFDLISNLLNQANIINSFIEKRTLAYGI